MDELLQDFTAETRETLEAISGELVAWEADPTDRARLDAIFRFVHTVKGSCGFLDLPRLGRLAHAAEDVLAAARDGLRQPDTALVSAVLAIVDRIGELNEAIVAGAPLDDSTDDLLIAALAEDAAPAAPISGTGPSRTVIRSVRLGVDLLDRMMIGMSDMVLARNELARRLRDTTPDPGSRVRSNGCPPASRTCATPSPAPGCSGSRRCSPPSPAWCATARRRWARMSR